MTLPINTEELFRGLVVESDRLNYKEGSCPKSV